LGGDVFDGVARGLGQVEYHRQCLGRGVQQATARGVRYDGVRRGGHVEVDGDPPTCSVHHDQVTFAGAVDVGRDHLDTGTSEGGLDCVGCRVCSKHGVQFDVGAQITKMGRLPS
jgi:hypothetical protein